LCKAACSKNFLEPPDNFEYKEQARQSAMIPRLLSFNSWPVWRCYLADFIPLVFATK
jgi:hypothetical protein